MHVRALSLMCFMGVLSFAAAPAFEVASVKAHELPRNAFGFHSNTSKIQISGNRVTLNMATLGTLIRDAYDVKELQISGVPVLRDQFGKEQFFDVAAKVAGDDTPTMEQVREMLQKLLAERFQLKLHREPRELAVYDLVVAKGGSKLKPSTERSSVPANPVTLDGNAMKFSAAKWPIADLVNFLKSNVDRPIVDRTDLTGTWDFTLEFTRNNPDVAPVDSPDADRSIYTAIQDQLGLRLAPAKEAVDVLVIDHAEKPSEN